MRCWTTIIVFAIVGLMGERAHGGKAYPNRAEDLYGTDVVEILRNPDRAEACLLNDPDDRHDATETTARKPVPMELLQTLIDDLLKESSYDWGLGKSCMTRYGARTIVYRGKDSVTIDFCFACSELRFDSTAYQKGEEDFDPGYERFAEFFQEMFPHDSELAKLPTNRKMMRTSYQAGFFAGLITLLVAVVVISVALVVLRRITAHNGIPG